MSTISCNLSSIRKKRNLKQTELARLTGLSQKALSELETGKSKGISFGTLSRLCDVLQVTVDQLFDVIPEEDAGLLNIARMPKPSCSFCGKNEQDVEILVMGRLRDRPSVFICSDCITRSHQLLQESRDEVPVGRPL